MLYSPLRYPGWKKRLAKFIGQICVDNNIDWHYIEPYAWWASVALYLLIEKKVKYITINDFDKSIYAFWYCVLNYTDELCKLIYDTEINIQNWKVLKEIQKNKEQINIQSKEDVLSLGFSTFFLNRTNRSWVINAWVIGWINQTWSYKMDCRFNKEDLVNRIRLISTFKDYIFLKNMDAINLLKKLKNLDNNCIFYFDPPYYLHWPELYLNFYSDQDHTYLSNEIKKLKNIHWITSYDNVDRINDLYSWVCNKIKFQLSHSIYKTRKWSEIIFFSDSITKINTGYIQKYINLD